MSDDLYKGKKLKIPGNIPVVYLALAAVLAISLIFVGVLMSPRHKHTVTQSEAISAKPANDVDVSKKNKKSTSSIDDHSYLASINKIQIKQKQMQNDYDDIKSVIEQIKLHLKQESDRTQINVLTTAVSKLNTTVTQLSNEYAKLKKSFKQSKIALKVRRKESYQARLRWKNLKPDFSLVSIQRWGDSLIANIKTTKSELSVLKNDVVDGWKIIIIHAPDCIKARSLKHGKTVQLCH